MLRGSVASSVNGLIKYAHPILVYPRYRSEQAAFAATATVVVDDSATAGFSVSHGQDRLPVCEPTMCQSYSSFSLP